MVFVSSKLFSGSPGEYMLGAKQTTKKRPLGGILLMYFLSRLFLSHSSLRLPGGGNGLLFFISLQLGTRLGVGGGFQMKETRPPPRQEFSILEGKYSNIILGLIL